ncbi:hypothetical protein HETIRDRAFT_426277 [Heterobasidion irregulare TC 32-1]|uniref:Uncharacterized protein n=1 Tax=Heterobasidion irregulare (strain TC 32-1) TaxID=747525 RepID=W4KBI2_HETIT|nr:uncharacterized protein HETIRDRAFT_426277 [Heterobasidion irregulare TC 32-1]ETW82710.1 hypothetical protein HETIRDRAFT_426277 [Heterobasidion irregulare TC 32-1]
MTVNSSERLCGGLNAKSAPDKWLRSPNGSGSGRMTVPERQALGAGDVLDKFRCKLSQINLKTTIHHSGLESLTCNCQPANPNQCTCHGQHLLTKFGSASLESLLLHEGWLVTKGRLVPEVDGTMGSVGKSWVVAGGRSSNRVVGVDMSFVEPMLGALGDEEILTFGSEIPAALIGNSKLFKSIANVA